MINESMPLTLRPKKSSAIWLLLGGAAFTGLGIWMAMSEGWVGYLCAAFGFLCVPIAIVQLLPGSSYLHIDSEGFTFAAMFRKTTVPWSVVQKFFVIAASQSGMKVHTMVGFNFVPSYRDSPLGRKLAMALAGGEAGLPDTYGKKAEDLAAFMNACLLKAKSMPPSR